MKDMNVNMYISSHGKYFNPEALPQVRQVLERVPDEALISLEAVDMKDPTTMLIISIFLGTLGVDRFMLGDIGLGILKLLTAGCCGILTIIDWFTVQKRTRSLNYSSFMTAASYMGEEEKNIVYSVDPTPETDVVEEERLAKKQKNMDEVSEAADKAKDAVVDVAGDVGEAFDSAKETIADGLGDLKEDLNEAKAEAKANAEKAKAGAKEKFDDIAEDIEDVIDKKEEK